MSDGVMETQNAANANDSITVQVPGTVQSTENVGTNLYTNGIHTTKDHPSHPPADPSSARPRTHLGRPLVDRRFSVSFRPITPHFPPRDRAHMTSDRALITGFVSRFSVVNSHSSSVSSFTLHVHPTGKLPESYLRIRQCPHHPKIPEKSPKNRRNRFFIINPSLIYINPFPSFHLITPYP